MTEDHKNTNNDTQAGSNTEPQTNTLINPFIDPQNPADDIFGNNILVPRVAQMRIASSPRYRIKANFKQEAAVLMNEIGQCTQMAVRTCYSQKTFTQAAYESIMQNCLTNPKITVVSYGVVEKIDQFGNPWEEWMDRFAIMPTMMPATDPISSETNPFAGQTFRAHTPMQIAELERQKKEWENSPFANNSGIDNAVLYAEMSKAERDALAESVREELRETYERELKYAVIASTRNGSEILDTVFGSAANVMTLGILNYLDPDKAKKLKLLRSKHKVAAVIGDGAGFLVPGTPASLLGEGTSKLVGTFAGKAGEIVTRKTGKILGQAVEGALTQGSAGYAQGFITEGVHSTLEGKSFEEIIGDAHNKGWDYAKGGLIAGGIFGAWNGFKGASGAGLDKKLMNELAESGVKYNADDVVAITKSSSGKTVWIENGSDSAGLKHIINEHGTDFLNKGISQDKIPDYLMKAIDKGKVVGHQGRGTGRPIYEFIYNGTTQRVGITIGDNGFIVGANPVSLK